jgi:predicted nucleic acid-binding Zn ribbon protein
LSLQQKIYPVYWSERIPLWRFETIGKKIMREKQDEGRFCRICGKPIAGRADKVYCSSDCRVYANNSKSKELREKRTTGEIARIGAELATMEEGGGVRYVKIVWLVTQFCKILYKFGR